MGLQYGAHGFQLHHNRLFNEKIKPVAPDDLSPVPHSHFKLSLKFDATHFELDLERPLIDRLEEARAQRGVYSDRSANHSP